MTSIWFPNNKYPPNTKNYLPCFVLGGGFSIRRKGLYIWTCTPQIKCRKRVTSKASTHIQTSLSTPQATNILPSLVVKSPLWNWAPVCSAASCDHKQWGSWRIDRERLYSCRQYFQPHKGSKLQDVGFSIPIQHQWHPFPASRLLQDYMLAMPP